MSPYWLTNGQPAARRRPSSAVALFACAALSLLAGCSAQRLMQVATNASPDTVAIRKTPDNPLTHTLNLMSSKGPEPTERTRQLLRRYDLLKMSEHDPGQALADLQQVIEQEPTAENVYAYAELAYVTAQQAERKKRPDVAAELYGAAVARAYLFLFDPRLDPTRNPYDPQFRQACDLYNESLEGVLRLANAEGKLKPGAVQTIRTGGREYRFVVTVEAPWRDDEFDRFEFASDYSVTGLTNVYRTYGLGVPLIAIRKQRPPAEPTEKYYPPGLAAPVTAFLRVHPNHAQHGADFCQLELRDPLTHPYVTIHGRAAPVESDLTTPIAYYLNTPLLKSPALATFGLLNGDTTKEIAGLYMLEPYDPRKVPVVMVHGLWSSPVTWTEMYNDLRSQPEIRENFQFWFYFYPTGQPFWISAAQMRADLARMQAELDPRQQAPALNQMVLVGHSMGGLVSRMQTIESRDELWSLVSDRPFDEVNADEETLAKLRTTFFFEPNPSIRRVVTIGTPHRGSEYANSTTQRLARSLIVLPTMVRQVSHQLVRDNPGYFHNVELLTTATSIDSLSPKSPVLPVMLNARRGSWVRYHNIVGEVPPDFLIGRFARNSDGIVSLASARMNDVESELVVPADHNTVHRHPRAVLEVRRILLSHLEMLRNEVVMAPRPGGPPVESTSPWSYATQSPFDRLVAPQGAAPAMHAAPLDSPSGGWPAGGYRQPHEAAAP